MDRAERSEEAGSMSRAARVEAAVSAIPSGFVRTYGDIDPSAPRYVGHVLASTTATLPWHRVVRADGSLPMGPAQRRRLVREGVPFVGDRVDLKVARVAGQRVRS